MNERALKTLDTSTELDIETLEKVLIQGDLSGLSREQLIRYNVQVCDAMGLDWRTQPFAYIRLNNKLVLYARKECTDQLRRNHNVSVYIKSREMVDDCYVVTAEARMGNGRTDSSTGVVAVGTSKGELKANAMMKAECVPYDSEILTRDGFKFHDELTVGDEVLAYDLEHDETVWTPLLAVRRYDATPTVRLRSDGRQFDVTCTADHKWAVAKSLYQARSETPRGPYANRRPDRLLLETSELNGNHSIVLSAGERQTSEDGSLLTPVEASILGWAVTDGTIRRVGNSVRIGICQSKPGHFAEIREVVTAAAGDVREVVSPPRTRTFPTGRTYETQEQHWWYLPAAISKLILERAGFHDRSDLPRIVTRLSSPARRAMLSAFMSAEGDARQQFANSSRPILDAFLILCALEGIATGEEHGREGVAVIRQKKTRQVACRFLEKSDSDVMPVWCPQTEFGTWVMRQNGRVMITGNTKAKRRVTLSICGLGMLDESETIDIPGAEFVSMEEVDEPTDDKLSKADAAKLLRDTKATGADGDWVNAYLKSRGFSRLAEMTQRDGEVMYRTAMSHRAAALKAPEPPSDPQAEIFTDDELEGFANLP